MNNINFFPLFIRKLINIFIMSQELKRLIREAFNNAYNTHSGKVLSEAITGGVDQALKSIIANPEVAKRYAWTPQGSANKLLNQVEFNSLVDELQKMLPVGENPANAQKLKQIMLSLYGPDNVALYNMAKRIIMSTLKVVPNEEMMVDSFVDGWNKIFLGNVETKASKDDRHSDPNVAPEFYKNFDQYVAEYNPAKNKNFGAYISQAIQNSVLQSYKDAIEENMPKSSLDAPSRTTGKPTDAADAEDFGSDAMHAGGADDTLRDFGGAFDDNNTSDAPAVDDLETLDTDSEENIGDESGTTLGSEIGDNLEGGEGVELSDDSTHTKQFSKEMINVLFGAINQAISIYSNKFPNDKTAVAMYGFPALQKIMKGEALDKLEDQAIKDLKKGNSATAKKFLPLVDYLLSKSDFEDLNGKFMSFQDLSIKNMRRAGKFLTTGEYERVTADDDADALAKSKISAFDRAQSRNKEVNDFEDELQNTSRGLKDMMKTIVGIKKTAKSISPEGENATALQVLSGLLSGISPQTISKNMGVSAEDELNKLKANPAFQMFSNLTAQDIADAAKSIKLGKPAKALAISPEEELQENRLWLIHNIIREEEELEYFIQKNITTIMENVYNKLSKLL